jgi:hypothetical protein
MNKFNIVATIPAHIEIKSILDIISRCMGENILAEIFEDDNENMYFRATKMDWKKPLSKKNSTVIETSAHLMGAVELNIFENVEEEITLVLFKDITKQNHVLLINIAYENNERKYVLKFEDSDAYSYYILSRLVNVLSGKIMLKEQCVFSCDTQHAVFSKEKMEELEQSDSNNMLAELTIMFMNSLIAVKEPTQIDINDILSNIELKTLSTKRLEFYVKKPFTGNHVYEVKFKDSLSLENVNIKDMNDEKKKRIKRVL